MSNKLHIIRGFQTAPERLHLPSTEVWGPSEPLWFSLLLCLLLSPRQHKLHTAHRPHHLHRIHHGTLLSHTILHTAQLFGFSIKDYCSLHPDLCLFGSVYLFMHLTLQGDSWILCKLLFVYQYICFYILFLHSLRFFYVLLISCLTIWHFKRHLYFSSCTSLPSLC